MENMAEIERIVAGELGRDKHARKSDTFVQNMFGKKYKELTHEEKSKYDSERYKANINEEKLAAKREYERKRYKEKKEEILAKARERYANKKEAKSVCQE